MKNIFLDFGVFMFRAIFASVNNPSVPATYTTMSMILSNLKHVGVHPDDRVIIAVDSSKGSWRKEIDSQYKANRKAQREKFPIDWHYWFSEYKKLLYQINVSTPFFIVEAEKLEADDLISYGVRRFNSETCVIISSDSDYEQLVAFSNVKIFSPLSKKYKIVKNPHTILAKKIEKERTDNLISPILNQADYNKRLMLVNLLELPAEIDNKAKEQFDLIDENKQWDLALFPFNSIQGRFQDIYSDKYVVKEPVEKIKPIKKAKVKGERKKSKSNKKASVP